MCSRFLLACTFLLGFAPLSVAAPPTADDPLHFWIWPSTIAHADLQKAIEQIRASGIETVADPAEQPWTYILLWNSDDWILQRAGEKDVIELGWTLTAAALKQHLPAGAKLWANIPPSQELGGKLDLRNPGGKVQGVSDATLADYVLTGTLTPDGPAWAWYHKVDFDKGSPNRNAPKHNPGCSSMSDYPVRTRWVPIPDLVGLRDAAGKLNDDAARLAKLAEWLHLPLTARASHDDSIDLGCVRETDPKSLPKGHRGGKNSGKGKSTGVPLGSGSGDSKPGD